MPPRYRAMVLLASWCALRFGELAELRRSDVDLKDGVVRVQRGVTRAGGEVWVGDPKSDAGRRTRAAVCPPGRNQAVGPPPLCAPLGSSHCPSPAFYARRDTPPQETHTYERRQAGTARPAAHRGRTHQDEISVLPDSGTPTGPTGMRSAGRASWPASASARPKTPTSRSEAGTYRSRVVRQIPSGRIRRPALVPAARG